MLYAILFALLVLFVLKISKDKYAKGNKRDVLDLDAKCTGCANLIEGRIIRVTAPNLKQPLNYCSQDCKEKNLDMDCIKFAIPQK